MTRAEIEELKCRNQNLTSDLTSAKAEIERLRKTAENYKHFYERTAILLAEAYKTAEEVSKNWGKAKTEAYKEFAERLKVKYKRHFSNEWRAVYDTIDNLVKELTEVSDNA